MAITLVSTVTVGSGGAASIEFTSIPQTGKDLLVLYSLRVTDSGTNSNDVLEFNSSTSSFTYRYLYGLGSSVGSADGSNSFIINSNASSTTANTFGSGSLTIANYTSSSNKSFSIDSVVENNATSSVQSLYAGQWANSAAITGIKFSKSSETFVQYTSVSLYIIS